MRANALIGTLAVAGIVALAGWSWHHANAARHAREALATLSGERQDLDAKLAAAERRFAETDAERTRRKATLEQLQKNAASPPVRPAAVAPPQSLSITDLIRNEPDAEVLFLATKRAELTARYGPLFRTLGLTPAQVAAFQDHVVRREEARMDLAEASRTQGPAASRAAIMTLQQQADAAYAEAQRALLGEAGYRQLQDYERVSNTRSMVSAIAGAAVLENAPFSAEQADRLVQAIANTSDSYRRGGPVVNAEIDWAAVEAHARTILSPAQFAVFSTIDSGPTRGGLLQTRMYALLSRVNAADLAASAQNIAAGKNAAAAEPVP
jgi:hypothetical protein